MTGPESVLHDLALTASYEVETRIADGGFGVVYKGRKRATGQAVAIKILHRSADGSTSKEDAERLEREMRLCAKLHHPHIVGLIDFVRTSRGDDFAVFEFVPGSNLADVLAAEGALDPEESIHLMLQVLDALACAHGEGVIHRDLKPANIMVTATGARRNALVLDFGIGTRIASARWSPLRPVTAPGEYLGTPAYSAPEQLRGLPVTPATDLFAWGLVLLECLTGRRAFEGPVPHVIHQKLGPEPLVLPEALAEHPLGHLLRQITAKDPGLRPHSATQVLRALQTMEHAQALVRDHFVGPQRRSTRSATTPRSWATQLSRVWSVSPSRNPNFTGREATLDSLRERLLTAPRLPLVALRGLGGVGKSQLALEYAYRHSHSYDLVAWIRAEEPESLIEDFAALAERLDLTERGTPDQRRLIEAVRVALERSHNWLLIFDNATNPDAIRTCLPGTTSGHIIVTSRHPSWRSVGLSISVEELEPYEAVDFLLERTGDTDYEAASELASELGHLPLALEEAAAYVEATGRSLRHYLELFRAEQRVLLTSPGTESPSALRGTWEISFRRLEELLPEAADLLRLCAFLAPDRIPLDLIRPARGSLPSRLAEAMADEWHFDRCVATLLGYSLIRVETDGVSLHRLVQLVIRERLSEGEREAWAQRAVGVADAVFPSGRAGDFSPEAGRLLPHAMAALEHAAGYTSGAIQAGSLLNRTGLYFSARGLYREANQAFGRSLQALRRTPEAHETEIAGVLHDHGLHLFGSGEPEAGREKLERALEIHERLHGPDDFRVALDLIGLGWIWLTLGDERSSLVCSERGAAIAALTLGEIHPMIAMTHSTGARALWMQRKLAEAHEGAARALAILGQCPVHHPVSCASWYNLGAFYLDVGSVADAERCVTEALEIGERAYGADHGLVVLSRALKGAVEAARGDLPSARRDLERALASGERAFTRLLDDVAIARSHLADVLRRSGERQLAEECLEHALQTIDSMLGDRTRILAHIHTTFAALRLDQGQPERSRSCALEALKTIELRFSQDHPLGAATFLALARAEEAMGSHGQARSFLDRALRLAVDAGGKDHPVSVECRILLARCGVEE